MPDRFPAITAGRCWYGPRDENDRALEPGPQELAPIRRPPHGEKPLLFAGLHGMKRPEARREESLAGAMQLSAVPIAASATFGRLAARRHLHTRPSLGDAGIRNDACRHRAPWARAPWARAHRPGTPAGHTGPATLARPLAVLELSRSQGSSSPRSSPLGSPVPRQTRRGIGAARRNGHSVPRQAIPAQFAAASGTAQRI